MNIPQKIRDRNEERLVGVQSVLRKPFDLETLSTAVDAELARARG